MEVFRTEVHVPVTFGQNADVGVAPKNTSAEMKQPQWNVFCMLLKLLLWAPFTFQTKEFGEKPSCCHFKQSTVRGGSPAPWGLWPRIIWLHSQCFLTVSFLYKNVNTQHQIAVIKCFVFFLKALSILIGIQNVLEAAYIFVSVMLTTNTSFL